MWPRSLAPIADSVDGPDHGKILCRSRKGKGRFLMAKQDAVLASRRSPGRIGQIGRKRCPAGHEVKDAPAGPARRKYRPRASVFLNPHPAGARRWDFSSEADRPGTQPNDPLTSIAFGHSSSRLECLGQTRLADSFLRHISSAQFIARQQRAYFWRSAS